MLEREAERVRGRMREGGCEVKREREATERISERIMVKVIKLNDFGSNRVWFK